MHDLAALFFVFCVGAALGVMIAAAVDGVSRAEDRRELRRLRAELAAFDHDGDGRAGGSRPRK